MWTSGPFCGARLLGTHIAPAGEEPMVCRLPSGGDWIRTFSYAGAVNLIIAPFADRLFRLLYATGCVDGEMAVEAWSYKRGSLAAGLEFLIRTAPIGRPQRAARVRGDHRHGRTKRSNHVPPASESISPGSRRPPEPAWRGQSRPARSRAVPVLMSH